MIVAGFIPLALYACTTSSVERPEVPFTSAAMVYAAGTTGIRSVLTQMSWGGWYTEREALGVPSQ